MSFRFDYVSADAWRPVAEARAKELGDGAIGLYTDRFGRPGRLVWKGVVDEGRIVKEEVIRRLRRKGAWVVVLSKGVPDAD